MIERGRSVIDFFSGLRGWFLGWYRFTDLVFFESAVIWIFVCVLGDVRGNLNVWCVITNVRCKRTAGAFSF